MSKSSSTKSGRHSKLKAQPVASSSSASGSDSSNESDLEEELAAFKEKAMLVVKKSKATDIDSSEESNISDEQSDPESGTDEEAASEIKSLDEDDDDSVVKLPPESSGESEAQNQPDTDEELDTDEEMSNVKKELSQMSFEDLQKLKEKLGVKVFNSAMYGDRNKGHKQAFKRENKNRPMEMSSKRSAVAASQPVIPVKKRVVRDPRFDDLSGDFREDLFNKSYGFISDIKERERHKLLSKLKKEKIPEKKQQLKVLIKRLDQQKSAAVEKQKRIEQAKAIKKEEQKMVEQGKKAYYLKKSDKKKLELAEKYKELKKSGKVDSYLHKKRKKTASKDKKNNL